MKNKLTPSQITSIQEEEEYEDSLWEDEGNFHSCDNCDLPDACADFGCAIQQGLRNEEY